jgi:hypothetical protein
MTLSARDELVVAVIEEGSEHSNLCETRSLAPVALQSRLTVLPSTVENFGAGIGREAPLTLALRTKAKAIFCNPGLG